MKAGTLTYASLLLALILSAWPATLRAQVVALDQPISFHGAEIVGYEKGAALGTETRLFRPSTPALMFINVKLKLSGPFEYARGRFREITLTDEDDQVYHYRGWLTDDGWMDLDGTGPPGENLGVMGSQEYPATLDLHFEVPKDARALLLHYEAATSLLFSLR